jgi:hypothetical protein
MSGSIYASVLPDPVSAIPIKSLPDIRHGIAYAYIGKGSKNFFLLISTYNILSFNPH